MPPHWPSGQPSFPRRPAPQNAGAGGEKTARSKGSIGPLRRGLASEQPHILPSLLGAAGCGDCSLAVCDRQTRLVFRHASRSSTTRGSRNGDTIGRPAPNVGHGRDAGARLRDAIQPPRLVWEGLEGATRPSMSMRRGSEGVGHRLGRCPNEIARKSRNRRWRVCISAPLSFTGLRVGSTI